MGQRFKFILPLVLFLFSFSLSEKIASLSRHIAADEEAPPIIGAMKVMEESQTPTAAVYLPQSTETQDIVKSCFQDLCKNNPFNETIKLTMNPKETESFNHPSASAFLFTKKALIAKKYNECIDSLSSLKVLDEQSSQLEIIKKALATQSQTCQGKFSQSSVSKKFFRDQEFLEATKDKVLKLHSKIFSAKVLGLLEQPYKEIYSSCYYNKNDSDLITYFINNQCSDVVKQIKSATTPSVIDSVVQEIKDQSINCDVLKKITYNTYPASANFRSLGDNNDNDEVIFSNQTCLNKELGEGIIAHEFAHALTKLFFQLPDDQKDEESVRNFRNLRKCLANQYSVRRSPQPGMIRDFVADELTTEEDYADIFKFSVANSSYPFACEIYDYSISSIREEVRLRRLGVFNILDDNNEHGTPIARFLHEIQYKNRELSENCLKVKAIATPYYVPTKCFPPETP